MNSSNKNTSRIGVKRISGLFCVMISLLFSCKSSNKKSHLERENFAKQYLQDRYSSDFELISLNRANAPGEKFYNYEAQFRSLTHDRRNFYLTFTGSDTLKVHIDQYPIILLEESFLELLDIKNHADFSVVFEIEGRSVMDNYLDGIHNLDDAKATLSSIEESAWNFFIYIIVDQPEERVKEIEDMLFNLLSQAYEILPAKASVKTYIYSDTSLTKTDIQPDMKEGIIKRTPHPDKMYEEWMMGWTPKNLKKYDNGFRTVIENKDIIPR